MVFCFLCPDTPPEKVSAKGSRGASQNAMLEMKENPHIFAVGLHNACCAEPCCCILSSLGSPLGCTACWARKAVLDRYYNGLDDYVCCQGYWPRCCCVDVPNCCRGSPAGLCLEGFCCGPFSLSIARIHLMHSKRIRPDPMDYQVIACSNCLQFISCILDIAAIFAKELRDLAHLVDLLADLVTCSVAGCMGAQIKHELKKDKDEIVFVVVEGVPVVEGQVGTYNPPGLAGQDAARGAPPTEEMER